MKLYHGSNIEINKITLSKSKKYKDFGQGFYATTILDQAIERAIDITERNGGEAIVTCFEFDDINLNNLNFKKFENISEEWALMVINNRKKDFEDFSNELSNHDNKYDIVFGPIANDDIRGSIVLFENGRYDIEDVKKRFKYKKLNDQYSFHTDKAIASLTKKWARAYNKTTEQDMMIQYLITQIVGYIANDNNISIEEALKLFYLTKLSNKIEDINTGYYKESANYLYEIIKEELNK